MPPLHDAAGRKRWITVLEENGVRYLYLDGSEEGAMFLDSDDPVFNYLWFCKWAGLSEQRPVRHLVLGAGAFTAAKCLALDFPDAQVDVVDIEPELFPLGKQFFQLERPEFRGIRFHGVPAEEFLSGKPAPYDFIFDDLFEGFQHVPILERGAGHFERLRACLAPGGVLVKNVIWDTRSPETQAACQAASAALRNAFASSAVLALGHPSRGHNRLLIGKSLPDPFDWPRIHSRLSQLGVPGDILNRAAVVRDEG